MNKKQEAEVVIGWGIICILGSMALTGVGVMIVGKGLEKMDKLIPKEK